VNFFKAVIPLFLIVLFISCDQQEDDTIPPMLDHDLAGSFPKNCDTLYFGNTYSFKYLLSDNLELHSLTIEISHNFDGHTHETAAPVCHTIEAKTPVFPFFYSNEFLLPQGLTVHTSDAIIWFPIEDCCGLPYDEGDYHVALRITDKAGLYSEKMLNIKLLIPVSH